MTTPTLRLTPTQLPTFQSASKDPDKYMRRTPVNLIVAMAPDRLIGVVNANGHGQLPWQYSADLSWFRTRTAGGVAIMGRKTWDSIPLGRTGEKLPDRVKIVLTSKPGSLGPGGASSAESLDDALDQVSVYREERPIWIIGGASVYQEALDRGLVRDLFLTRVPAPARALAEDEQPVLFPDLDWSKWTKISDFTPPAEPRIRFELYRPIPGGSRIETG